MIHKNWSELIKPMQLVVKPGPDASRTATVIAEPLERGFGLTLGNSMLLSSWTDDWVKLPVDSKKFYELLQQKIKSSKNKKKAKFTGVNDLSKSSRT